MCLLGLSSVLKSQIDSFYPNMEDLMCKQLFYQVIVPRIQNTQQKCKLQLFSQIILYHYCGFLRTAEKAKELELWVLEKST